MTNIEEKKQEIAAAHEAAQEAMQKMFTALDAFDSILLDKPEEDAAQNDELANLYASIFNRKVWFVKCFASRYGGLLFM